MARHSRRQRTRTRKMRGGGYGSAASYGEYVNGTTDAQFNRVFGSEYASVPGNAIIGAQGQNITPATRIPTPAQLAAAQSGGKRRKSAGGYVRGRQPNVWDVLAQSSDPRMAYTTGVVQSEPQMMQSQPQFDNSRIMGSQVVRARGGKRRYKGLLGEVVDESTLPAAGVFTVLSMQPKYTRKKGGKRHSRRYRKH